MNLTKHIPNLITLANLFCGSLATIFAVQQEYKLAALWVCLGIFLDFFDGFAARLLKVTGELGKQLDSLADMVTSGVVPGIVMLNLLKNNDSTIDFSGASSLKDYIPFLGLILTLGACYRLANFNIDTRQSNSFIGLPTPAMSLFVVFLPFIKVTYNTEFVQVLFANTYLLVAITLFLTYIMNAEINLFSLKFKNFKIKNNWVKYVFLIFSVLMIIFLQYTSIPFIILLYVLFSVVLNAFNKSI